MLPIVYSEAYQITKDPFFANVVKKTLDYVIREMTSSGGTFFSAQDADTYGEEGDFINYVKGANIAGFIKVADAMIDQGVV